MGIRETAGRVSELAARQWGLLTTAQAEGEGITRLQLARLADAGVIKRIDRGIYAAPAAIDEHTTLRAAWLSLEPAKLAEQRLGAAVESGVISHASAAALHGIGDLADDEPEITAPGRKQSRRGIRLHRGALRADEVTIIEGLPVTTPARTVADLLETGTTLPISQRSPVRCSDAISRHGTIWRSHWSRLHTGTDNRTVPRCLSTFSTLWD